MRKHLFIYLVLAIKEEEKKIHSNSALLWQAIKDAKDNKKNEIFDLGGLNESTP